MNDKQKLIKLEKEMAAINATFDAAPNTQRDDVALAVLQALLSNPKVSSNYIATRVSDAFKFADEFVKQGEVKSGN